MRKSRQKRPSLPGRKVVFLGDCLAGALMRVYREFVVPVTHETVEWVDPAKVTDGDLQRVAVADAVAVQVFNVEKNSKMPAVNVRRGALKLEFPSLFIGFLWPFSGREAHVKNAPTLRLVDGPYPAQIGDTFLNKLIREGVGAEEALKRYLELDIVHIAHLDRLLELHLGAQESRDEKTGFAFARVIEKQFRATRLFLTSSHPTVTLFQPLVQGVLDRLGVPAAVRKKAVEAQKAPPFPNQSLPIHPSVIRHFGLRFVDETSRYPFNCEGSFTFTEFVVRYMNYTWNRDLLEGITLARGQDMQQAHVTLERALRTSPDSAEGWRAMSLVHQRAGRLLEARSAAERAVAIDPGHPSHRAELALVALKEQQETAVTRFLSAQALLRQGNVDEALAITRDLLAGSSRNAHFHALLGHILAKRNDLNGAVAAFRTAVEIDSSVEGFRASLASTLSRQEKATKT